MKMKHRRPIAARARCGGVWVGPSGYSQPLLSGTALIDRPIADVFAFLAEGTNDPKFSPRVIEIHKEPDGPSGLGTIFVSRSRTPHDH